LHKKRAQDAQDDGREALSEFTGPGGHSPRITLVAIQAQRKIKIFPAFSGAKTTGLVNFLLPMTTQIFRLPACVGQVFA